LTSLSPKKIATSMLAVTLVALMLVLVAVFLLPVVIPAAMPEIEDPSELVRLIIWAIVLLYFAWMGVLVALRLYEAWVMRQTQVVGMPHELSAQLAQVRGDFESAARQLRRGWGGAGSRGAPTVLILGETGAGKSAALEGSQLSLRLMDEQGTHYSGRHGRLAALVRCEQAVVIDTDGSLTAIAERRPVWLEVLRQLRLREAELGLAAVVLVVNLARLVGPAGPEAARGIGGRLRSQLDDIAREVGVTPPVHLLFTHVDTLPGFVEVFGGGAGREGGAFGRLFPIEAREGGSMQVQFMNLLEDLLGAVEARRPLALANANPWRWGRALLFAGQLRACKNAMAELTHVVSQRREGVSRLPLAGFWLASATQSGASQPGVEVELDHRFGLSAGGRVDAAGAPSAAVGPMFLRELFASVLTRPSPGAALAKEESVRQEAKRRRQALGTGLGVVLLGGMLAGFGLTGIRALKLLEAQAETLQQALADHPGVVDPAGLEALIVLHDLAGLRWRTADGEAPERLLEWAWAATGEERPGWLRRTMLAVVRWGVRPGAKSLTQAYAQARLVVPAQTLLKREVAGLDAGAPKELAQQAEGEPLPAHLREWATSAWFVTDLAVRWRALALPGLTQADLDAQHIAVAEGIVDLIVRLRVQGAALDPAGMAVDAERALLVAWFADSDPGKWQAGLPELDDVKRLQGRLAPVEGRHLLFAVALESTSPPGALVQRAGLIRTTGGVTPTAGPSGFVPASCGEFEDSLNEHLQQGTFDGYRADDGTKLNAEQVLADYRTAHRVAWSRWIDTISVSSDRIPQSPAPLGVALDDVFRPGGDLDRLLSVVAAPTPPPESAEGSVAEPNSCRCLRESLWIPEALGAGGPLRAEVEGLQGAMDALTQDLRVLAQDGDARRQRVHETLAGKGVIADAAAAAERLGRSMRGFAQPDALCPGVRAQDLRAMNDLWAVRVEELSFQLINASWRWLIREFEQDAERAWTAEVLPDWQRLRGRYPLRTSGDDLSVEDLSALLGEGGVLDTFLQTWLTPLVTSGGMRRPTWPGAPTLELTTATLSMLQGRNVVHRTIEALGQEWSVGLSCGRQPRCAPPTVTSVRVLLDGQPALVHENMGRGDTVQSRVKVNTAWQVSAREGQQRDRQCLLMEGAGAWALFRLLDNGGNSGSVTLRQGECGLQLGFAESQGGPRTTLNALRRLGLPDRLFIPVAVQ
jgi:type VI protein secretion system component VasK